MKNSKNQVFMLIMLIFSLGAPQNICTMGEGEEGPTELNFNEPESGLTLSEKAQKIAEEQNRHKSKSALTRAIDWLTTKISTPKITTGVGLDTTNDKFTQPDATKAPDNANIHLKEPGITFGAGTHTDHVFKKTSLEDNINNMFTSYSGQKIKRTQLQEELTSLTRSNIPEDATYAQAKAQFIASAAIIRPLLPTNVILIPIERPSTQSSESFTTDFQFELVKMDGYDPKLTIEQNAEQIKKAQGLKIQARDTQTNNTRTLSAYIRHYLEENPSKDNLKALLLDNTRGKDGMKEILTNPGMKKLFNDISAQELTDITNKQIANQPKALKTPSSMLYESAKHFFQFKADDYQPFFTDKLIIPIESASRNNRASFTFDIIDISKQKLALKSDNPDLTQIAQALKKEQNLKLTTIEIKEQLELYLKDQNKQQSTKINTPQPLPFLTEPELPTFKPQDDVALIPKVNSESGMSDSKNSQPDQPKIIRLDSPFTSAQDRTTYLTALINQLDEQFQSVATNPSSKISDIMQEYKNTPVLYNSSARRTLEITPDGDGLLDYQWSDTQKSREAFAALQKSYENTVQNIKSAIRKQVPNNQQISLSNNVIITISQDTQKDIVDVIFKKYFEQDLSKIQNEMVEKYIKERIEDENQYEDIQYNERTLRPLNPFTQPLTLSASNIKFHPAEQENLNAYFNTQINEIFTPEKMIQLNLSSTASTPELHTAIVKMNILRELSTVLPYNTIIRLPNNEQIMITKDLQEQLVQEALNNNFVQEGEYQRFLFKPSQ